MILIKMDIYLLDATSLSEGPMKSEYFLKVYDKKNIYSIWLKADIRF
jgi:hypothetical protein